MMSDLEALRGFANDILRLDTSDGLNGVWWYLKVRPAAIKHGLLTAKTAGAGIFSIIPTRILSTSTHGS